MIRREGEYVPFGYGFVRYRPEYIADEFLPMPINWIKRYAEQAWWWLLDRSKVKQDYALKQAMRAEFERGRGIGWKEGVRDSWKGSFDLVQHEFSKKRDTE